MVAKSYIFYDFMVAEYIWIHLWFKKFDFVSLFDQLKENDITLLYKRRGAGFDERLEWCFQAFPFYD